jgi:hypothetical protein
MIETPVPRRCGRFVFVNIKICQKPVFTGLDSGPIFSRVPHYVSFIFHASINCQRGANQGGCL